MGPHTLVKDSSREMKCSHNIPCGLDKDGMFTVRICFVKDRETGEVASEMEMKISVYTTVQRLSFMIEELAELPHNSFHLYGTLEKLKSYGAPKFHKMRVFWFAFEFASQTHVVYVAMGLGAELDMFSPIPDSESDDEDGFELKIIHCFLDADGEGDESENILTLKVLPNHIISFVKELITKHTGIPVHRQQLQFGKYFETVLEDDKTVSFYNMQDGSEIIVALLDDNQQD